MTATREASGDSGRLYFHEQRYTDIYNNFYPVQLHIIYHFTCVLYLFFFKSAVVLAIPGLTL